MGIHSDIQKLTTFVRFPRHLADGLGAFYSAISKNPQSFSQYTKEDLAYLVNECAKWIEFSNRPKVSAHQEKIYHTLLDLIDFAIEQIRVEFIGINVVKLCRRAISQASQTSGGTLNEIDWFARASQRAIDILERIASRPESLMENARSSFFQENNGAKKEETRAKAQTSAQKAARRAAEAEAQRLAREAVRRAAEAEAQRLAQKAAQSQAERRPAPDGQLVLGGLPEYNRQMHERRLRSMGRSGCDDPSDVVGDFVQVATALEDGSTPDFAEDGMPENAFTNMRPIPGRPLTAKEFAAKRAALLARKTNG